MRLKIKATALAALIFISASAYVYADAPGQPQGQTVNCTSISPVFISTTQKRMENIPVGDRIAFWAEIFAGTPYDQDPLGAYVRAERIVCDSEVDCMYHVFRSVELATSKTPEEAVERALTLRFMTHGKVVGGRVSNYDERYQYGEDMIDSGKWGEDVTNALGVTMQVQGSRGRNSVTILPKEELLKPESYGKLNNGDLIFFIKDPSRRVVGEIVGHLGVIKVEGRTPALIHASGTKAVKDKQGCGTVKSVDLLQYVKEMRFIGVKVTRFK